MSAARVLCPIPRGRHRFTVATLRPPSISAPQGLCAAPGPAVAQGPWHESTVDLWAAYALQRLAGEVHHPSVSGRSMRDVWRQQAAALSERCPC